MKDGDQQKHEPNQQHHETNRPQDQDRAWQASRRTLWAFLLRAAGISHTALLDQKDRVSHGHTFSGPKEVRFPYPLSVDVGAIGAAQVGQQPSLRDLLDRGVPPRDGLFGQDQIILSSATDADHRSLQRVNLSGQAALLEYQIHRTSGYLEHLGEDKLGVTKPNGISVLEDTRFLDLFAVHKGSVAATDVKDTEILALGLDPGMLP